MKRKRDKNQRIKDKKGIPIIFVVICNTLLILGFFIYKSIPFSIWKIFFLIILISTFVFLNVSLFKFKEKDTGCRLSYFILFFLTILYTSIYSYLSIIQYNGFFTGHEDLAALNQAMWNTIHGRILYTTIYGCTLRIHMSPILILLAPFYYLWQDPRMLLILQSLFLGLGAIPIYLIAKDKLKHNLLSLSFSFAYLFHPFLSRVNLFEFHVIPFAPFFLLFTFYFLQRKTWWLYSIFLFFSLMVKEDVSLIITALGIYAFFKVNRKVGIITFLIGMFWAYLSVKVLIPYIRLATGGEPQRVHDIFSRYSLGSTTSEVIKNLVLNPQNILKMLFLPFSEKLATIILLIIPIGFLSLLSPVILIALPEIILHFMAGWNAQYLLCFQYSAPITPWAVLAGIYGCLLLKRIKPISLAILILASSLLSNFYFSFKAFDANSQNSIAYVSFPNNHKSLLSIPKKEVLEKYYQIKMERALFESLKSLVLKDLPVSIQDNLLAHFSQRKIPFYTFPDFDKAEYIILNTYGKDWVAPWSNPEECKKGVEKLLKDDRFQIFFKKDSGAGEAILLFGKKGRKGEIINNAEKLVKENPKLPEAHFILGSIYFNTN